MTQASTNDTFHVQTNQHENVRPTDANSVEFLNGTPSSLDKNAKRIWIDQPDEAAYFTVDGVSIIELARKNMLPFINVQDHPYNAKGNGSTSDTLAIQQALDVAITKGSVNIFVPDGVYPITSQLRVHENTTFWMSESATLRRDFVGTMLTNGEAGNPNYATGYDGDGNISIIGGTFDLNGTNFPPSPITNNGGTAFSFAHAEAITVHGVTFINGVNDHYFELNSTKNAKVTGCTFKDASVFGTGSYEAINIDYSIMSGFPSWGAWDNTPCIDILIDGNTFENVHLAVGTHSVLVVGTQVFHDNIRVTNNTMKTMIHTGIRAEGWRRSIISGNTTYSSSETGIDIISCQDLTVSTNNIESVTTHGIAITAAAGLTPSNILITGNMVTNATLHFLHIVGALDVEFTSNLLLVSRDRGVFVADSTQINVKANTIRGASQGSPNTFAGIFYTNTTASEISQNTVTNEGYTDNYNYAIQVDATCSSIRALANNYTFGGTGGVSISNPATVNMFAPVWMEENITGLISVSSGVVTLNKDITRYKYLIVGTGATGTQTLRHEIVRPFNDALFIPGTDAINVNTSSGKFVATITTATSITIVTANDNLRYILGIR